MARSLTLAIMAFLFLMSLLLLSIPFAFPQNSGPQPVGKASGTSDPAEAADEGHYLLGVGKADITGYAW
jgi:hypothetical protein